MAAIKGLTWRQARWGFDLLQKKQEVQYSGNKVYENGVLKRILLPNGYISDNIYYFCVRNFIVRTIIIKSKTVFEIK